MHTSEDIFWKSSPKERRGTAPLLPCRAFSTVINCLSTSGLTVRRALLQADIQPAPQRSEACR